MMDEPFNNVIESFRGLGDNQARAQFLRALVPELTSYERREVRDVLNQDTYQMDIITSLPLELVLIIFQHLDLWELFSLQRVSRSWQQRLLSHEVCKVLLHRYYPEEGILVDTNNLDPTTGLLLRARRRHAFHTGRPYSKASFVVEEGDAETYQGPVAAVPYFDYHDGKLVWVGRKGGTATAHVRDLVSGQYSRIIPQNRENIIQVKISDSLVAVMSSLGVCHVLDHHTGQKNTFRLPFISRIRISITGRRVATAGPPSKAGSASLILWDFDTQETRELNVSWDSDLYLQSVLLHAYEDAVYLITGWTVEQAGVVSGGPFNDAIEVLKYNFQEELISRSACQTGDQWKPEDYLMGPVPTSGQGHLTIAFQTLDMGIIDPIMMKSLFWDHCVLYDTRSDKLTHERFYRRQKRLYGDGDGNYDLAPRQLHEIMHWEDVAYTATFYGGIVLHSFYDKPSIRQTEILDIDHSFANAEKRSASVMRGQVSLNRRDWLLGDEAFLVSIGTEEIEVWCFEKDLVMADEEPQYRAERTRRADGRAAERRLNCLKA